MLIACVNVAVCTFAGELAGHSAIVLVALLAVASFGAGMFIALGVPTYFVALTAPLTITVASSAPADAGHALERAAFAFAGGLFVIALVLGALARARPPARAPGDRQGLPGPGRVG